MTTDTTPDAGITDAELAEWERLSEAATPPPWVNTPYEVMQAHKPGSVVVARMAMQDICTDGRPPFPVDSDGIPFDPWNDPAFIAAARTALPRLLAEVKRLRAAPHTPPLAAEPEAADRAEVLSSLWAFKQYGLLPDNPTGEQIEAATERVASYLGSKNAKRHRDVVVAEIARIGSRGLAAEPEADEVQAAVERRRSGGSVGFTNASVLPDSVKELVKDATILADTIAALTERVRGLESTASRQAGVIGEQGVRLLDLEAENARLRGAAGNLIEAAIAGDWHRHSAVEALAAALLAGRHREQG